MPSPIDIERAFHRLSLQLRGRISDGRRFWLIREFLDWLEPPYNRYESYILQLTDHLPPFDHPLSFTGIDPDLLLDLYHLFESIEIDLPELKEKVESYRQWSARIRRVTALLYAMAGDLEQMLAVLPIDQDDQLQSIARSVQKESVDPYDSLLKLLNHARSEGVAALSQLDELKKFWDRCRHAEEGVLVPVVERESDEEESYSRGRLRRLRLHLGPDESDGLSRLLPHFSMARSAGETDAFFDIPLSAAESLLYRTHPRLSDDGIRGYLSYELLDPLHQGRSCYLAVAGLVYARQLNASEVRERYRFRSTTAVTGDLDQNGRVQTVKEESLSQKVKAAFFSWVNQLVVPAGQGEQAREYLQSLQERYPHRRLTIIEVESLEDLFEHRKVVEIEQQALFSYYGKLLWNRKEMVSAALLLVAIGVAILIPLQYGTWSQNPAEVMVEGGNLVVKNEYGQTLDRLKASPMATWYQGRQSKRDRYQLFTLGDMNGDTFQDLCWFEFKGDQPPDWSVLHCKDIRADTMLWSRKLRYDLDYPGQSYAMSDKYMGKHLELVDAGDGQQLLVVIANHTLYFPAVLETVDPRDGFRKGRYVHAGRLQTLEPTDIDSNGRKELLAVGETNSYNQAAVALLDPMLLDGRSPSTAAYRPAGVPNIPEIAYFQIPHTVVARSYPYNNANNRAINIERRRTRWMIQVQELQENKESRWPINNSVDYFAYFDSTLRLRGVGTNNAYDDFVSELLERGRLSEKPDSDYYNQFADSIQYWNDGSWRRGEAINEAYRSWRDEMERPAYER